MNFSIKDIEKDNNPTVWEEQFMLGKSVSAFKYRCDFYRDLLTLKNNQIYIPNPKLLNDPNEGYLDFSEFYKELAELEKDYPDSERIKNIKRLLKEESENVGIFSLSKYCTIECLWSYYANGHKGFCIEYDLTKLQKSFKTDLEYLLEVTYKSDRESINIDETEKLLKYNKKAFVRYFHFTKSKEWEQEQEIRIVTYNRGYCDITKDCIKAIYFGKRCSDENINLTMNTLKEFNIQYYKMDFKTDNFGMIYKPIKLH